MSASLPVTLRIEVPTPSTPVQVTVDTRLTPQAVYIEAHKDNTGYILVMRSNGDDQTYMAKLNAGEAFQIGAQGGTLINGGRGVQLSGIYIDAEIADEAALVTYLPRA